MFLFCTTSPCGLYSNLSSLALEKPYVLCFMYFVLVSVTHMYALCAEISLVERLHVIHHKGEQFAFAALNHYRYLTHHSIVRDDSWQIPTCVFMIIWKW